MISHIKVNRGEQGFVLIWVLFYFVLFEILALSFMNDSILEVLISINHRWEVQAFAMADGGAIAGAEQIYMILSRDYSHSQEIPAQLTLDQQQWQFDGQGKNLSFKMENPRRVFQADGECGFQFRSQGDCAPAQKKLLVEVRIKFTDYYRIHYGTDGIALLIFDHRDFIYPAQITSLQF